MRPHLYPSTSTTLDILLLYTQPGISDRLGPEYAAEQPPEFPEGNSSAGQVVAHATTLLKAARKLREPGHEDLAVEIERIMEKADSRTAEKPASKKLADIKYLL